MAKRGVSFHLPAAPAGYRYEGKPSVKFVVEGYAYPKPTRAPKAPSKPEKPKPMDVRVVSVSKPAGRAMGRKGR